MYLNNSIRMSMSDSSTINIDTTSSNRRQSIVMEGPEGGLRQTSASKAESHSNGLTQESTAFSNTESYGEGVGSAISTSKTFEKTSVSQSTSPSTNPNNDSTNPFQVASSSNITDVKLYEKYRNSNRLFIKDQAHLLKVFDPHLSLKLKNLQGKSYSIMTIQSIMNEYESFNSNSKYKNIF